MCWLKGRDSTRCHWAGGSQDVPGHCVFFPVFCVPDWAKLKPPHRGPFDITVTAELKAHLGFFGGVVD